MVDEEHYEELVEVFKALADATRLRLLGLVAERPRTGKELAELLGVGAPTVSHHVAKLQQAKLLKATRDGQSRIYTFDPTAMRRLAAGPNVSTNASVEAQKEDEAGEAEHRKVIRDFFDGDRLKQIPAQRKKRVIVLQHLLSRFEPERDYPEREVNDLLRAAHEDFATLRRELVDYGFMTRAGGVYRVARDLPLHSNQVRQEITGDEDAWLRTLLSSVPARP
ncbi:MAG: metalloregulator ArsR/SmtB family transcription factor [Thermomicrobiales bacterium]